MLVASNIEASRFEVGRNYNTYSGQLVITYQAVKFKPLNAPTRYLCSVFTSKARTGTYKRQRNRTP